MKSDLKEYKGYIILYSAQETEDGLFYPLATLFKSGEDVVSLNLDRTFVSKDQALSYAIGASEETINSILKGEQTEYMIVNA